MCTNIQKKEGEFKLACFKIIYFSVALFIQGKKRYQEKLFISFQLSQRVPKDNFYSRLSEVLELNFLYAKTKQYYGRIRLKHFNIIYGIMQWLLLLLGGIIFYPFNSSLVIFILIII